MGMTNEEIIYCLSEPCIDACCKCSRYGTSEYRWGYCRTEVLRDALEIVEKYRKIEQIYSDYLKYMNPDNLVERLGEVIADRSEEE